MVGGPGAFYSGTSAAKHTRLRGRSTVSERILLEDTEYSIFESPHDKCLLEMALERSRYIHNTYVCFLPPFYVFLDRLFAGDFPLLPWVGFSLLGFQLGSLRFQRKDGKFHLHTFHSPVLAVRSPLEVGLAFSSSAFAFFFVGLRILSS